MNKFKVGDKVCVVVSDEGYGLYKDSVHTVDSVSTAGNIGLKDISVIQWASNRFEILEPNPVLTPEEVFEHLQKGTKVQHFNYIYGWTDVNAPEWLYYKDICNEKFRIKPEPEVIELNGKKYREIVE